MKKFLKSLAERAGDLVIKLISVKGLFSVGTTILALKLESDIMYPFIAWSIFVSLRDLKKIMDLIGTLKGGK